ncbi:MAG: hypothetical protein CNE95_00705 [Puniceicoccaceae bacterium MED-G30]|jgi:iduronate 2-sulfatase|nr:MAG: hypothetical protein CNE95_00705 [Puniceicoccaceae bacterium MED-G30]
MDLFNKRCRLMMHRVCIILLLFCTAICRGDSPNVLFIAIDDLRPDLNCYEETAAEQMGGPSARLPIQSPAIDSIASQGMVFERAYCQIPLCGPSRLSIMTSTYPDRTGVYAMGNSYGGDWRSYISDGSSIVSLPQQFRAHGYTAVSYGKIYDSRLGLDVGISWDEEETTWRGYNDSQNSENRAVIEAADVADNAYTDGKTADLALDFLQTHETQTPFFLAVGFAKPHLPFNAPKSYWDLYNPLALPLSGPDNLPHGLSEYTLSRPYKELETYTQPVSYAPIVQPTSEALTRQLVHGYLACTSYVDAQIAKIIDDLKERGLYEETIIIIWGDHGFKLDDFSEWAKATTLEIDSRVPLIIRLPASMTADRDAHSYSMVELVDVMPTVLEAAGLPIPDTAQGRSLMPILQDADSSVRQTALTQYKRSPGMAYSVRSNQWRYTEFRTTSGTLVERQLFDLSTVPHVETTNVVDSTAYFPDALSTLIFDKSGGAVGTRGDGLTIFFGNDNLVDGAPQNEIPGSSGNKTPAALSALMDGTSESSTHITGLFSISAPGLTFDMAVSCNRSHLKAQGTGLGVYGGAGGTVIDNDFANSGFQESITFLLENINGLPAGYDLVFTKLALGWADASEPLILNGGAEGPASEIITLNNHSNVLTIQAGALAEAKYPVWSVTVDLVEDSAGANPAAVEISNLRFSGGRLAADLNGTGFYSVWKSNSLSPPLFIGPIESGISSGTNRSIDADPSGVNAFYRILPEGRTP